jgi:hypothetical protein
VAEQSMSSSYTIRVMTEDELREWRAGVVGAAAQSAKLAECGYLPLAFLAASRFMWLCPGCGLFSRGQIGDEPVSGWDGPAWTVEGVPDHLTLNPSLGCPRWRDGTCIGHWWARNGKLVLA